MLVSFIVALAFAPPPPPPEVLPLRKLRLYEVGVGYFERRGGVPAKRDLALPLPASHLDDALKTLVILDATGDARVRGVQFATAVSESNARAIAGLPEEAESAIEYGDVLLSLEGADVEVVHDGGKVRGRLLEVEGPFKPAAKKEKDDDDDAPADPDAQEGWYAIVVVDAQGGVHRIRTNELASVRALDPATQSRLQVAAAALSDQSARRPHPLDVRVSSTGQLALGYIAEAPVWRTTYRVVLPDEGSKAELQAWALVHNDTDEHWRSVSLELANGRPQSFLYPLASPRYARRELTGPEDDLSTVPQLANTTADRLWGDHEGGLGLVGTGMGGGGTGEGTIGLGSIGTIGHGSGSGSGSGYEGGPQLGDLAELSKAEGAESGALFVYRVLDPLDLDAHHSALVPIVQERIEAESITWFAANDDVALTGARVVNSTSQTLPAGVISFFADGGFVGEAALRRLKPKERQFTAFGVEQDVELSRAYEPVSRDVVGVFWAKDTLHVRAIVSERVELALHNQSGRARQVYVALPLDRNAKIEGDVGLDWDVETAAALAIVGVPARKSVERNLRVERVEVTTPALAADVLETLAKSKGVAEDDRRRLAGAAAHTRARDEANADVALLGDDLRRRQAELGRLRADLEALGKARLRGRVSKRLAQKMLVAERDVEQLRDRIRGAEGRASASERAANAELKAL
jgi:hypothetical protein